MTRRSRFTPVARTVPALLAAFTLAAALLAAPAPAAAHENEGFIYGKVTTRSGNEYQGIIRWDDEEAFWDDLFHSYKESRPYEDFLEEQASAPRADKDSEAQARRLEKEGEQLDRKLETLSVRMEEVSMELEDVNDPKERRKLSEETRKLAEQMAELALQRADIAMEAADLDRDLSRFLKRNDRSINILGGKINLNWNNWSSATRIFISRFGDIDKIKVIGSEDAELTMRTGSTYVVSGYSNDVGGTIVVTDDTFGTVELDWKKIDSIDFMETPRSVSPGAFRLHGVVTADGGEYRGYIQWDSQECLSTDELDGDSEDGSLSIPMGNIRSIERRSRGSAWVEMKDGRRLQLEGSNDVDQSIRGIMVEDPRYGRCKIPWDAFDKVVFDDKSGSGEGYDDYAPKKLQATVTDTDGKTYSGHLVFDLDESESWEMLNGDLFDIEWDIPFANVESIRPRSRNASTVQLHSGEELRLEGGQDVSDNNDGVLVFVDGTNNEPKYIEWDRIETIEFK